MKFMEGIPIIIFGNSTFSEVCWYYFTYSSEYFISNFTVHEKYINDTFKLNIPVLRFEYITNTFPMFIAVGYGERLKLRERIYNEAKDKGFELVSFIHPNVERNNAIFGNNVFIMEENSIQPFVEIGNNVTLFPNNHIGHHSKIGNHTFIASKVCICGNVTIGDNCFIGAGSTIQDGVILSDNSFIKMGSLVTQKYIYHMGNKYELD